MQTLQEWIMMKLFGYTLGFVVLFHINFADDAGIPREVFGGSQIGLGKFIVIVVKECPLKLVAKLSRLITFSEWMRSLLRFFGELQT